jgi:hypothetical protein
MPETKRPLKVFLCHASADKPAVRDLYKRLTADSVDAWLDAENLIAGQNWQVKIPKAIRESDVVIVCLSKKSVNKEGYVQKEIKFALDVADEKPEGTIFIVPVRLEECEVPNRLNIYHWVDLFEDTGYKKIMLALNEKAKRIEVDFDLQKEYLAFTPSDKFFVKEIIEELEKQEEKPSFWKKITSTIINFFLHRDIKPLWISSALLLISFIVLALASIFGLPALAGEPEPTAIATITISPTKTLIPSFTPTFVPLSAVTDIDFILTTFSGVRLGVNYVNCPKVIANITANGQGMITYHWIRSDEAIAPTQTLFFSEAGTRSVSQEWGLGSGAGSTNKWLGIYVDNPNSQDFGHISVVACVAP